MVRSREELENARFMTYIEGSNYYRIGGCNFRKMAREANAIFRSGKRYLVVKEVMDAYLEGRKERGEWPYDK